MCLEAHRAGCGIDLIVHRKQGAAIQFGLLLTVININRNLLARTHACQHRLQTVLWNSEQYGDRPGLCDHHNAVRIAGTHDIALIHLAQAELAGDGRCHARVSHLQTCVVYLSLIDLHRAFELAHQRLLTGNLLLGNGILL